MSVIETRELTKTYGRIRALRQVSLAVEKGQIYGLLGQNGAGKTTLIKILLGLVRKSDGDARLFGEDAGLARARTRVGYLPEAHRLPAYLTGRQVQLQTKVDPGIIAGAVARIGSTVYDGSVTTQLQKVKERLVNAAAE